MSRFDKFSFSSANVFPLKVFLNNSLVKSCRKEKRVIPVHVQMNWTNKCNFNCDMCSCSERDRTMELTYRQLRVINSTVQSLGCEAYTITGGGEPTIHKDFDRIIKDLVRLDISSGLVTNGTKLLNIKTMNEIIWCRISASDYLPLQLKNINIQTGLWFRNLSETIVDNDSVDWAFSYVVSTHPNYELIKRVVDFANFYGLTHVRLVNDIFIAEHLTSQMDNIKNYLLDSGVDDSIVNYQYRSEWTKGNTPCYISLAKPVIGADGYVYPCCGVQYALNNPSRDFEMRMRMGKTNQLLEIYKNQMFFDGLICDKCYYNHYNKSLDVLLHGLKHEEFV